MKCRRNPSGQKARGNGYITGRFQAQQGHRSEADGHRVAEAKGAKCALRTDWLYARNRAGRPQDFGACQRWRVRPRQIDRVCGGHVRGIDPPALIERRPAMRPPARTGLARSRAEDALVRLRTALAAPRCGAVLQHCGYIDDAYFGGADGCREARRFTTAATVTNPAHDCRGRPRSPPTGFRLRRIRRNCRNETIPILFQSPATTGSRVDCGLVGSRRVLSKESHALRSSAHEVPPWLHFNRSV
jgi:hypothetical protein